MAMMMKRAQAMQTELQHAEAVRMAMADELIGRIIQFTDETPAILIGNIEQDEESAASSVEAPPDLLAKLGRLAAVATDIKLQIDETAVAAKQAGATWANIGEAAGITPQSAYQRWSAQGREKHRDYQRKRRAGGID